MIRVSEPLLGDEEASNLRQCIASGWISSSGEFLDQFEEGWSKYCQRAGGVAVANGTVALQLAVSALNLSPGDEVIMPTFTIISCALAALYNDCVPVFVDADPDTWCIDTNLVEDRITPRTRAILPVHIYGHPFDVDPILLLARRYELKVIEDAAEAHGAEYYSSCTESWRRCGGFGDVSVFSFYANKLITTGEGGMVVADDESILARARSRRNLGFLPERRFLHRELGFNFRMTNLQAAIGVAQFRRVDQIVERKRVIGRRYSELLAPLQDRVQLPVERAWARSVYCMYGIVLRDESPDPVIVAGRLAEHGIETRPFFLGLHEQPALQRETEAMRQEFPVAERLARRGLYLPSGVGLSDEEIERVACAVTEALS